MDDFFEGFEQRDIDTDGARIRLRHGGSGPPLLLLHGNPMSHVSWHKVANPLAEHFHVIAPDLRGYGDSSAPEPGSKDINYSFRAMAEDQLQVMEEFGYRKFDVAGHDRGGRVVHRLALDHPDRIGKAAVVDIVPSHHIWTHTSMAWADSSWHWTFMIQPGGLPERMFAAVPARWFMERKLGKPGIGLEFFDPRAFDEYVRCFDEKTIRGSCADYRACATCDLEMDSADFAAGNKVTVPLLAIWGALSHTGKVYGNLLPIWRLYADDVAGGPIDCGHYVQEQAPGETLRWFLDFFAGD